MVWGVISRGAARDSVPTCGGGMGWGVVPRGKTVPRSPTPDPSPAEPRCSEGSATQQSDRSRQQPTSVGGGEEFAALLSHKATSIKAAPLRGLAATAPSPTLPRKRGREKSAPC